jgi:hypothetical protein
MGRNISPRANLMRLATALLLAAVVLAALALVLLIAA